MFWKIFIAWDVLGSAIKYLGKPTKSPPFGKQMWYDIADL
jgi:hypothetical protein